MFSVIKALFFSLVAAIAYGFVQPRFKSAVVGVSSQHISLPTIVLATLNKSKDSCKCAQCMGTGALNCVPCKGTGIDKVNGNVFERWTCSKCKGFGFVRCVCNPTSGLTPEQRGER